ncbi:MAG: cobalamin-dependent protein [Phycisphaerae bacterium]|jgi:radical SAM superfamily enzyme YgiQ (UPF0313 family)
MSIIDIPRPVVFSASTDSAATQPVHPLGGQARVLLCSVFGPYAQDDEYGSRTINPMELWHNQVTRAQGPFSFREFHRNWGLMLIQANIEARCTVLDFPSLDRFIQELHDNEYDIVGISSIMPNVLKVKKMCELIREHLPTATIVIGGHIANLADLDERVDADHIVRGDGVAWFRAFLGEDPQRRMVHPQLWGGFGHRALGINLPFNSHNTSAALIPSVGCPMGCNFCSTSAMFGGKGKFVNFYPDADELFAVMCQLEEAMKINAFFVMDENFLLQRPRALKLLELMRRHEKTWVMYTFSSANAMNMYSVEELVGLGISWLWLGLEGAQSQYGKLAGADTHELVAKLQDHGIRVLGSSIIGLEEHTPANIDQAIAHAVSHGTDFHQFMLYTAVAGTPLHAEHQANGTLLSADEILLPDTHGQYRFNIRHPHIRDGQETEILQRAFDEDFRVNGPSVLRVFATTLKGWKRYRNHPERRIRERFAWECQGMAVAYAAAAWAARKWFKDNPRVRSLLDNMLKDIYREFGLKARLSAPLVGRYVYGSLRREDKRLKGGWTYEPPTFYERNYEDPDAPVQATVIQSVPGRATQAAAAVTAR